MSETKADRKSMICKKLLLNSYCPNQGGTCEYAHSDAELTIGFLPGSLSSYKTEACKNGTGKCIFSAGCYYYHDVAEKREEGQEKKGTPCPFFSKSGVCYFLEPNVPESCPYDH